MKVVDSTDRVRTAGATTVRMRNASEVEGLLVRLFKAEIDPEAMDDALDGAQVYAFADAGLLTRDRGVRLKLLSGAAFQITIVKSERGDELADRQEYAAHLVNQHGWDRDDAQIEAADR